MFRIYSNFFLNERGQYKRLDFYNKAGVAIENSWKIANYSWQYQDDGSVIESRFSLKGELQTHRPGFEFKRIRLVFDSRGHLSLMQNLNESHKLLESKSGAAQYRYFYQASGTFHRWEIYDANGKPALGPTGTAGEQYANDFMNQRKIAFFDTQGKPSLHASGAAYWILQYDHFGNVSELSLYDVNEKLTVGVQGFARLRYYWGGTGLNLLRKDYLDTRGRLKNTRDGLARIEYPRDQKGEVLSELKYDETGKLLVDGEG